MTLERRYLLNREVQSVDAATRTVELAKAGYVSGLMLRLEATNGATSGTEELIDAIDRVEIIADGSDVLFSLEGTELYKWNWVWQRKRPPYRRTMRAAGVQEISLLVPFGRFLGDPDLYLNLNRYQRVELRIQYSPTISATTFATGTFTISVIEYGWRAGAAPGGTLGFLRTRQIRSFTSAASGDDITELDRRYPLMGALVYAREAAIEDGTDISIVEVREDDGRVIPYTGRWLDLQMENEELLGLDPTEHGIALRTDNGTIDTLVSRIMSASVELEDDTGAADATQPVGAIASITADRITLSIVEVDEDAAHGASALATALYPIHWIARGIGVGNAVFLPLALPGDVANPYPAPEKSKVEIALTQAGAGAAVRVSTQELVAA
ncbi:MAG: hypothetical protein ACREEO_14375 [Phenylobacterium sp.]